MIVLGIDPGLATTGFAFLQMHKNRPQILDFGVILTNKNLPLAARLLELADEIAVLIKKHRPDFLGIEKLVFQKNITSGMQVAHARGVVLAEAERAGVQIYEIQPTEVKMRITGYGNAPKIQVQRMIQKIFNLAEIPKPDDAADALAIAYASVGEENIRLMA